MIRWKPLAVLGLWLAAPLCAQPHRAMDYGPFLTMSVEVAPGDIAQKALCIRLDEGPGGVSQGRRFVAFDTDTLRYAAAWSGRGFIDWRGIIFNGNHNAHPKIVGTRTFANPTAPGWGDANGEFEDTRLKGLDDKRYGPLPREWGHWKGLHHIGDQVVLHYEVGGTTVRELPALLGEDVFVRRVRMAPHEGTRVMQVAFERRATPTLLHSTTLEPSSDTTAMRSVVLIPVNDVAIPTNDQLKLGRTDYTIAAWIKTRAGGSIFSKAAPRGEWVRNGKTLFVRGGRLGFDVGWVGAVQSKQRVNDGQWHHVAMTHRGSDGRVTLYVDGEKDGDGDLPADDGKDHVVRIGYTATTFMPPFKGSIDDVQVFRRVLSDADLVRLADGGTVAKAEARWTFDDARGGKAPSAVDRGYLAHLDGARLGKGKTGKGLVFDGRGQVRIGDRFTDQPVVKDDEGNQTVLALAIAGEAAARATWQFQDGNVRLRLPGSRVGRAFSVMHWRGKRRDLDGFAKALQDPQPVADFEKLRRPPTLPRRPEVVQTKARRVHDEGPFAVDEITLPNDNPWRSWLRLGGFDFFDDGDRAAVASWQGDVWIVEGLSKLDGDDETLSWQCIASGLFQPLGLKIKDGDIYVLGRDQITRLVDRDGDGETDYYENFNNDAQVTEHFHEFAMDLQTDAAGNFYYMKGARHAKTAIVPQHGTLVKVSADGSTSEVIASGFRAPNGLSVNPDGTFYTSDQEGHWTPMNRINHVKRGGFYGNMMGYCPERKDTSTDPPLCWIHKNTDRSPAAQLWVESEKWGELNGALLSLSYGTGRIWNVLHETVGGVTQGGIVQLPMPEFPTGIQRGRFHREDGQLYVCGLFGWSSNKTRPGGFFRVSRTREPLGLPTSLNVLEDGVVIGFSEPLDPKTAADPRRYRIERWNYKRTRNYGSKDWKVSDGTRGRDKVQVLGAKLSRDGRAIFLRIADMTPCMQMEIHYSAPTTRGATLSGKVHHSIHALGNGAELAARFDGGLTAGNGAVADAPDRKRGLQLTVRSALPGRAGEVNRSVTRLAALRVEPGMVPSPFVTRGPFTATWQGFIDVEAPGRYRFHADTTSAVRVTIGGMTVIEARTGRRESRRLDGSTIELLGPTPIRVDLSSDDQGLASFRLLWSSATFASEPVPPRFLSHAPNAKLGADLEIDRGRTLFASSGCVRCHELPGGHHVIHRTTMPELWEEAPDLSEAGSRFGKAWMFEWMLEPRRWQRHSKMPDLFPTGDRDARRDAADIAAWLSGQTADPGPITAVPEGADVDTGLALYEDLGCIACHTFDDEQGRHGDEYRRTTLAHAAAKFRPGALREYLKKPNRFHAWTRMPDYGLDDREAAALEVFIRSRSRDRLGPNRDLDGGDAVRGQDAFRARGCATCHRVGTQPIERSDLAPALPLGKPHDSGCLSERPTSRSADYRFSDADRRAIRDFLAATNGLSLQQIAPHHAAERAISAARCTACHDRDGESAHRLDILLAQGRKSAVLETIPPLTWAGEKLHSSWTESLLRGRLGQRPRPWMRARMPAFPAHGPIIARGLPAAHGVPLTEPGRPEVDQSLARIGQQLALGDGGFNCNQCHGVGDRQAFGPFGDRGVNFTQVGDRLRHDFYLRWMRHPQRVEPDTKMPRFSPDGGKTAVTKILDGDADAQMEALWHYLASKPQSSRAFVRKWTVAELAPKLGALERGRSFEKGRALFKSMACSQCHKVGDAGGTIGPDLTRIADKHQPLALLQEVLLPSKVIEDQYKTHVIFTKEDDTIDGMRLSEDARTVKILTNPLDPKSAVTVKKSDIDERRISDVSPMPPDLLNTLEESEILDLLAFVRAGGNPAHPSFKRN